MHSTDHNTAQTESASISIVIPAWNEEQHLEATLKSVKYSIQSVSENTEAYHWNVIVVDNNSTDGTANIAAQAGANVVFDPVNQIARARNTGARASNSDWLIFLDADTTLSADLLAETINALASGLVVGGGSTVAVDRELQGLTKVLLQGWNWYSVRFGFAAGCYIFCRKDDFDNAGGFDERYYAAEEFYLSTQLRKQAKIRNHQFVILDTHPIVSSARKIEWYSGTQKIRQLLPVSYTHLTLPTTPYV